MRTWLAVALALVASRAWAQPDADKPAEPSPPTDAPAPAEPPPAPPQPLQQTPTPVAPVEQKPIASEPEPVPPPPRSEVHDASDTGFRFGSYGRILADTDLRGGKPEKILVGTVGPRIVEDTYLELESSYGFVTDRGVKLRPVITLAFEGNLFHDTGVFDSQPALRNMFLDAQLNKHLSIWAGSRMYRGDDIYLFDYWPLDNLNTVGGGVFYRRDEGNPVSGGDAIELAAHAGVNRLDNPFQYQTISVPDPAQGATTVTQLNRQRMIASASAAYILDGGPGNVSIKGKLYGELHSLPSGTFLRDDNTLEQLPSDGGYLIGGEISVFGMQPAGSKFRRHLNLYMRYASGLAAFDPLAQPTSFGIDLKTTNANELSFGASGNWDHKLGNVMIGAISRRFIDASGQESGNPNDGWEYALDARPLLRIAPDWFVGADISYQARFPDGVNPTTLRAEDPAVFEIAPMFVFSPMGPSGYDRPQIRFVYRGAHLNEGALDQYVPDDPRHGHSWVHYLGIQAEWWFNSSTYSH